MNRKLATAILIGIFLTPVLATADNKGLEDPEGAMVTESHGKITVLRSQPQGMEYGSGKNRLDAEVIFKLDKEPGKTFGIRLHEGTDPSIFYMTDLLREAFVNDLNVTVLHNKVEGVVNYPVIWVEITH
ncbi:MAG: hypothetical protein D6698_08220 [Gammaproteobacteria bacterium]|nr:MAG: hypothetical protein D6698_08220 [Gammaproteobacteria bacterium]